MKPKLRQAQIAELIGQHGEVSVETLAEQFDVSPETIRRDLGLLAETGTVQKVHGGARRPRLLCEGSFQQRMSENAEAKRVIARKLAALIEPGDTIFIDTGSTTLICAEALATIADLTVITNSPRIAQVFDAGQRAAIYLLGGRYDPDNAETTGPLVIEQIAAFQADHAVLTVAAIDIKAGAMDSNFDEARVARAMIAHARHVFVLANAGKIGREAAFHVCDCDRIDVLVTDQPPDPAIAASLRGAGVDLR